MDYEEMANKYGIKWPHDERCQGDRRCREHFIERLKAAKAEVGDEALFFITVSLRPDGPPMSDLEVRRIDPETKDSPEEKSILVFRQKTR